jgi:hypothetical protein
MFQHIFYGREKRHNTSLVWITCTNVSQAHYGPLLKSMDLQCGITLRTFTLIKRVHKQDNSTVY